VSIKDDDTLEQLRAAWRNCEPEHRAMVLRTLRREMELSRRLATEERTAVETTGVFSADIEALITRLGKGHIAYRTAFEILRLL